MNFKFPSSLDNNPPNPNYNGNPNSSYFSQQAIRAGYVTGDVNRREGNGITTTRDVRPREFERLTSTNDLRRHEFEGFASTNDVRRHEIEGFTPTNGVKRHEFEGFTSTCDVRRRQFGYSSNSVDAIGMNPIDVRGSMEREMAKERIRAEIIAEENRKRLLEEEVRRELMREKVSGFRHGDYGIGGSTGLIRMEPRWDPFSRNFEHRDRGRIDGGSGVWSHREVEFGGGFDTMQYNQDHRVAGRSGSGVILREIKEVDRVVDPHDPSKDKAIVLAKSSANLGYLKRKTMPPPVGGVTEVIKKQKTKEHWRCALCQVTATSERGLKDHFQGKKHQANEKGIVPHRTGFGTEPLPNMVNSSTVKPVVKPLTLLSIPRTSNVKKNVKRHGESSVAKADSAPLRNATHLPLKLKKTGKALATGKKNKQKKGFQFFCEMCQIGANSMIVFDGHKKGKKHLANLSLTNKTDEAAQNSNDTLVKSKRTSSNKRGNREAKGPASGKKVMPKKKFQYFCEICQIGANSLTVFDAHMNGKKHSAKLSELSITDDSVRVEASPQKGPSSGENVDGDFKKEETSGVNSDGYGKEEIVETDGENFEGDVKADLEETGEESFDGEELDETGGEDFDDVVNEELEETGGEDFDDDVNEELEETGGEDFDDDFKDGLEENGAES